MHSADQEKLLHALRLLQRRVSDEHTQLRWRPHQFGARLRPRWKNSNRHLSIRAPRLTWHRLQLLPLNWRATRLGDPGSYPGWRQPHRYARSVGLYRAVWRRTRGGRLSRWFECGLLLEKFPLWMPFLWPILGAHSPMNASDFLCAENLKFLSAVLQAIPKADFSPSRGDDMTPLDWGEIVSNNAFVFFISMGFSAFSIL